MQKNPPSSLIRTDGFYTECLDEECGDLRSKIVSGLLSPRVLGCRAEDAAADAHREFVGRHETFTITIPESVWSTGGTLAYLRNIPSSRILELQRGALRARARAMYTTEGDCRDANFAIASVLAERFRAHQAKKTG